ncbi:MAG: OmpA family protein [Sneathiellales bacterium]|nr:OmpA family protein [Sneathiellales bacterium]
MLKPFRLTSSSASTTALTFAAVLTATGLTAFSSQAQTVVIGGAGGQAVQVNMGAGLPAQQPYYRPNVSPSQSSQQDFSKGSRIVYGDEVIVLTPPGSKPKKKIVAAKKKKKPVPTVSRAPKKEPAKAEIKKLASTPVDQEMKKEPPKMAEKKPQAPAAPKPAETIAEKKELAPQPDVKKQVAQPEKTVAEKPSTPPPAVTVEKQQSAEKVPAPNTEKEVVAAPAPVAEEKKTMEVAALAPEKKAAPTEQPKPEKEVSTPEVKSEATNQILFEKEKSSLPGGADTQLAKLATLLKSGEDRVQLIAYADAGSNSAARRLSLGRALEVRSKLMELGIPNNRIEVRALGRPKDSSPADRVDLKVIAR